MGEPMTENQERKFEAVKARGGKSVSRGRQWQTDCPFCGKEGHLCLNIQTGAAHCKVCGWGGSIDHVCEQILGKAAGPPRPIAPRTTKPSAPSHGWRLEKAQAWWTDERGISLEALEELGIRINLTDQRFEFPVCDAAGRQISSKWRYFDGRYQSPPRSRAAWFNLDKATRGLKPTDEVWIAEGMTDVVTLHHCGIRAICSTGGAGKPIPDDGVEHLMAAGVRSVVVLFDNDDACRTGTRRVKEILGGRIDRVRYLRWEEKDPIGCDVSSAHRALGFDCRDLRRKLGSLPEFAFYDPTKWRDGASIVMRLESRRHWFCERLQIPRDERTGSYTLAAGTPSDGKSLIFQHLGLCAASGQPFLGELEVEQGPVIYIDQDTDSDMALGLRIRRIAEGMGLTDCVELDDYVEGPHGQLTLTKVVKPILKPSLKGMITVSTGEGWDLKNPGHALEIAEACRAKRAVLLVLDALRSFGIDENDIKAVGLYHQSISQIMTTSGVAVITIHHVVKSRAGKSPMQLVSGFGGLTAKPGQCFLVEGPGWRDKLRRVQMFKARDGKPGLVYLFDWEFDDTVDDGPVTFSFGGITEAARPATTIALIASEMQRIFEALGPDTWLTRKELRQNEDLQRLGMAQQTMVRALDQLEAEGIIVKEKRGPHHAWHYRLAREEERLDLE